MPNAGKRLASNRSRATPGGSCDPARVCVRENAPKIEQLKGPDYGRSSQRNFLRQARLTGCPLIWQVNRCQPLGIDLKAVGVPRTHRRFLRDEHAVLADAIHGP